MKGSVFPFGIGVALPTSILAAVVKYLSNEGIFVIAKNNFLKDNAAWSGFTFALGFLVIFRTSQAYSRFWDGCTSLYRMRVEWFDACSGLVAFCILSEKPRECRESFKFLLIRLFSILHALALAEIEDCNSRAPEDLGALRFELLDPQAVDPESLRAIKNSECKLELVFQWIQQLIVENIQTGVLAIPPPILSRSFQELANGMLAQHEAVKISNIPFPFPYAQLCEHLLMFHSLLSPFVTATFVESVGMASVFCFVQVFALWTLNRIAVEIENPFGYDSNDLDFPEAQMEMNRSLALLLTTDCNRTPHLVENKLFLDQESFGGERGYKEKCGADASLLEVWSTLETTHNSLVHLRELPAIEPGVSFKSEEEFHLTTTAERWRGKKVLYRRSLRSRGAKIKDPKHLSRSVILALFTQEASSAALRIDTHEVDDVQRTSGRGAHVLPPTSEVDRGNAADVKQTSPTDGDNYSRQTSPSDGENCRRIDKPTTGIGKTAEEIRRLARCETETLVLAQADEEIRVILNVTEAGI